MIRPISSPVYFLVLCLLFAGCKTPALIEHEAIGDVPPHYPNIQDSSRLAAVDWIDFFKDPLLIQLIDTALENNLDLQKALQRIAAARADVRSGKGLLFPAVDGVARIGQERTSEYSVNWAGNEGGTFASGDPLRPLYSDLYLGLQTTWELDIWGKLRNQRKAASARYLASQEGKNWVVTNLVSDVANTYYELLALDNELQIIRENIQLQENALSIVKIQKSAGVANELAVKQFEAQLLNFKSLEREVLRAIIETENRMNLLLGRYPTPIERNQNIFDDSIPGQIRAGIPAELLHHRPDIRQAEYELTAARADVKSARAAFFPSLSIFGGFGYNAFNTRYLLFTPESFAYNIFGGLTAPLINRSAIKADFNRANAAQMEALFNYQQAILNGFTEVSNELATIRNLEVIHELKSREVEVLTSSIETSANLFKTGRATYLEVLLTQQNALQANLELINTRKRQYNSITNLYKALGGGWDK